MRNLANGLIHASILLLPLLTSSWGHSEESVISKERLRVGGTARVRAEALDRTDFGSSRATTLLRIRPEVEFRPDSDLTVFLQPHIIRTFGEVIYPGISPSSNTAQQTSGATFDPSLGIHQGYIEYALSDEVSLIAGRQVLSYGDELIIGGLDWNNSGRSFDAFRVRGKHALGNSEFFASKLTESGVGDVGSNDNSFYGLYNAWTLQGALPVELDTYVLHSIDGRGVLPASFKLWTLGIRARSIVGRTDYRWEGNYQFGSAKETNIRARQVDGELGYIVFEDIKGRLFTGGFYASGDYTQLYPTAHKWLGIADVFGRRNIVGANFGMSFRPAQRWAVKLEALKFYRATHHSPAYQLNGTTALGGASGSDSRDLGAELDLILKFEASQRVALTGGGAVFLPGRYLLAQYGSKNPLFYYTQLEVSF